MRRRNGTNRFMLVAVIIVVLVSTLFPGNGNGSSTRSCAVADALSTTIAFGATSLLSGGLTSCNAGLNASTCVGGLASMLAFARNNISNSDFLFVVPEIDTTTPFVQMHPLGLSVNTEVFKMIGADSFTLKPSFFSSHRDSANARLLFNDSVRPLMTNSDIPSTDEWRYYCRTRRIFTDGNGVRFGLLYITTSQLAFASDAVPTLRAAVRSLKRDADVTVVLYQDQAVTVDEALRQLDAETTPDIILDASDRTGSAPVSIAQLVATNTTSQRVYKLASQFQEVAVLLTIRLADSAVPAPAAAGAKPASAAITAVELKAPSVKALPESHKDDAYYRLLGQLRAMAHDATSHDPILSHAVASAPKSRLDGYYPCLGRECEQGTLITRALAWRYGADIAFLNGGGPRGPGWGPGPLRTSAVWAMYTFPNKPCVGTLLGQKVWELFNASMAFSTMESDVYSVLGDRFMQSYGVEVDWDNGTESVRAGTRIRAIRILDRQSGAYKPLERLKYYRFATDTYQCVDMKDIAPIILSQRTGEALTTTYSEEIIQTSINEFLAAHDPYTPQLYNYLRRVPVVGANRRDGTATSPSQAAAADPSSHFMLWNADPSACGTHQRWSQGHRSCLECPAGEQRDSVDISLCVAIPRASPADHTVIYILVPVAVVLIASLGVAVFIVWWRAVGNMRDTKHAPKGDHAAIVFTDVQMSTKLWGAVPASMGMALDQHHALIREIIAKHKAYEVKTVGDSFMIACQTPQQAVDLSMQIQNDFMRALWPRCIDLVYKAESYPTNLSLSMARAFMADNNSSEAGVGRPTATTAGDGRNGVVGVGGILEDLASCSAAVASEGFLTLNAGGPNGRISDIDDNPDDVTAVGVEGYIFSPESKPALANNNNSTSNNNYYGRGGGGNKPAPHVSLDYHGLRVRIGIHFGPVEAVFDEVAKGYDYYGNTVNVAARIESAADGGQVVMSRAVANGIAADDAKYRQELLGSVYLKGIAEPTELLQVLPVALVNRVFTVKAMENLLLAAEAAASSPDGHLQQSVGFVGGGHPDGMGTPSAATASDQQKDSDRLSRASSSLMNGAGGGGGGGGRLAGECEYVVREGLRRALKPLRPDVRGRHIDVLAKAWRIQLPPPSSSLANNTHHHHHLNNNSTINVATVTPAEQADYVLSIIAQRVGSTIQLGGPLNAINNANANNTAIINGLNPLISGGGGGGGGNNSNHINARYYNSLNNSNSNTNTVVFQRPRSTAHHQQQQQQQPVANGSYFKARSSSASHHPPMQQAQVPSLRASVVEGFGGGGLRTAEATGNNSVAVSPVTAPLGFSPLIGSPSHAEQ